MPGKAFGNFKTSDKPVTGNDDDNVVDSSTNVDSTKINGGDGNDLIVGSDAADRVNAGDGGDTVKGGLGDDILFGNDGEDTAVFSGSIVDYIWEWTKGNTLNVSGADGNDQLKHFEYLQFDDFTYSVDSNNGPLALLRSAATTEENTALTLSVDMYDFDGDAVSVVSVSTSRGSVSANEGLTSNQAAAVGSSEGLEIAFDPLTDFDYLAVGQATIETVTLVLEDSQGNQTTTTFDITVTGSNDAPTLAAGVAAAVEDGPTVDVDLSALGADVDSDDDGSSLSYAVTGAPSGGSASITGTTLSFAPGADFQDLAVGETRDVVVQITATDAHGATAVNDVTVTVTGSNDAPTLAAGVAAAVEDGPTVDVDLSTLGADVDSDDDGSSLSYAVTGAPSGGSASITGTTLSFAPGADFQDLAVGETRDVVVQITATDAHGATAVNDVTVTVTGTNDAPTLAAGVAAAVEDGPTVDVDLSTLGADVDSDDDGSSLSYAVTGAPSGGSASITGTTLSFAPGADFQDLAVGETRDVVVQITATDAHGATAVNDVTVTVTGTNDAPVAAALTVSGDEDTTIAGAVTAIDPDQGETLSYALESGPSNGTVAVNSDGTFSYVGDSNFNGADSFVFRVDDGLGGADTEVVTVNVASVNDAPTASGGSGSVTEDGTLTTSGSITASDADGDSLGYSVVGGGAGNYGSLTVDASGNWEYILANAANNVQALNSGDAVLDSFQILVDDGNGGTAFADVDITVNGADEQSSDLEGQAILWRYLFPTAGSTYYQNSFDVSNGVETRLYNGGPASVDFREDDIFIDFDSFGSSWSTASFNGFEFTFQDADAPALVGFVLDTNMSGLDASDIAFDDDSLSVNWQGLSFSSSTYVEIDFIFG